MEKVVINQSFRIISRRFFTEIKTLWMEEEGHYDLLLTTITANVLVAAIELGEYINMDKISNSFQSVKFRALNVSLTNPLNRDLKIKTPLESY